MLSGTESLPVMCQPAWSRSRTAWAPGATALEILLLRAALRVDQMECHGRRRTARQHQGGSLALGWADGAEDVGRAGALVVRRAQPRATACPATGDLVLLPDPGFVLEPDLYGLACGLARRDLRQDRGEVFLNAEVAPLSWA